MEIHSFRSPGAVKAPTERPSARDESWFADLQSELNDAMTLTEILIREVGMLTERLFGNAESTPTPGRIRTPRSSPDFTCGQAGAALDNVEHLTGQLQNLAIMLNRLKAIA